MDKIKIGQVVNVVGLKGELKVYHYSDYKERFEELKQIYLENKVYKITGIRYMKDMVILKIYGIDDRTEAEKHKGKNIYIGKEDLRELPKDTYHVFDLIGLLVVDQEGRDLGILSDVIQNSAQDIYEIEREDKSKFLIPAVEEFILDIDLKTKTIKVKLLDGLLEL